MWQSAHAGAPVARRRDDAREAVQERSRIMHWSRPLGCQRAPVSIRNELQVQTALPRSAAGRMDAGGKTRGGRRERAASALSSPAAVAIAWRRTRDCGRLLRRRGSAERRQAGIPEAGPQREAGACSSDGCDRTRIARASGLGAAGSGWPLVDRRSARWHDVVTPAGPGGDI